MSVKKVVRKMTSKEFMEKCTANIQENKIVNQESLMEIFSDISCAMGLGPNKLTIGDL